MKYFIKTYGCQMNISDSERIASLLESAGHVKTSQESAADLVVLNTCSVRQTAIDRIFGNLKKYKKIKKVNPNFKTVVTGCVLDKDKEKFKNLFDLVIDIKEIDKIPEKLGIENKNDRYKNIESYFGIDAKHKSDITAYVPIMTGCNNFCAYCVVPYTRGREKSRLPEEIIREIADLINKGYKEIILLGQNVNSYKPDNRTNFSGLLRMINELPGNFWIRFLTSHPKDMTEELVKAVAECDKCTEYMHLALQSGDMEILKMMNRKYTPEHYIRVVELIRKYIPDAAVTTDIIVGFPGETEEQFTHTAEIMKKSRFDMAYINKYSPRAGTASSKLADNVSWDEKKRREKVLTEILKETAFENNRKYLGKTIDVLVEKVEDGILFGKSRTFKNVKIKSDCHPDAPGCAEISRALDRKMGFFATSALQNDKQTLTSSIVPGLFIKVKITSVGAFGLEGEIL